MLSHCLASGLLLILAPAQEDARDSGQEAGDPPSLTLEQELSLAVDLPRPTKRRATAKRLARRRGLELEELLEAMRSFGEFSPYDPGEHVERIELPVAGKVEQTDLFLYVPYGYDPGVPAPLMLSFHGTGGGGRGMHRMWRAVADELGMLVLAPGEAGANGGYAFSDRERAAALAALRWMRRRFNVDENRVYASGISRGGHLAWDLALRFPDRFAAIAPMIGGPRINLSRGQNNLRYMENLLYLPIRDLQGSKDDPGLLYNLHLAFEKLEAWGAQDAQLIEFPQLGHWFEFEAVDWVSFLEGCERQPQRQHLIRRCAREGETRTHWAEVLLMDKGIGEKVRPSVPQAKWNGMDEDQRRRFLLLEAEKKTARLEIRMASSGRFEASTKGVKRLRLLLTEEMFDHKQPLEINLNGKRIKRRVKPSKEVLLLEFVERFDRTFLPIAELIVK